MGASIGDLGVKIAIVSRKRRIKVSATNLGDFDGNSSNDGATDLELQALSDGGTLRVVLTVNSASDGNTYVYCADFIDVAVQVDVSMFRFRASSHASVAPLGCSTGGSPSGAFLPPPAFRN
jgi:hypothetical protein